MLCQLGEHQSPYLGLDLPATFLCLLVLRMPGADKAGTVPSRPCGFPPLILERGEQLCFASLIRNARSYIYARDDDCAPETSPLRAVLLCDRPPGMAPETSSCNLIPSFPCSCFASRSFSHTHTRARTVCLHTHPSLFFFPFWLLLAILF